MQVDVVNYSGQKLPNVPPKNGESRYIGIYDSAGS